jgi:FO synthase
MITHSKSELSYKEAIQWTQQFPQDVDKLFEDSSALRNNIWGDAITYSPKAFVPLTKLCRNHCDYCSFRHSPDEKSLYTMTLKKVQEILLEANKMGCSEALFCLGDRPESAFQPYRDFLAEQDCSTTTDYIEKACRIALEFGLLPHTNSGVLTKNEMAQLKQVNASMGLMLENVSERLCQKGMPHYKAPDKKPRKRLKMIREAGELQIPFTTGLLLGIGETPEERIDTLFAIRELHQKYGHIQEVIVQNFRDHSQLSPSHCQELNDTEVAFYIALARLILPYEISIQSPPNLNSDCISLLLQAGINDFGGISPLTIDYVNSEHPWPDVSSLREQCHELGFRLSPRLTIYKNFLDKKGYIHPTMETFINEAQSHLSHVISFEKNPGEIQKPKSTTNLKVLQA